MGNSFWIKWVASTISQQQNVEHGLISGLRFGCVFKWDDLNNLCRNGILEATLQSFTNYFMPFYCDELGNFLSFFFLFVKNMIFFFENRTASTDSYLKRLEFYDF